MTISVELVVETKIRKKYIKQLQAYLPKDDCIELETAYYYNVLESYPKDQSLVLFKACYIDRLESLLRDINPKRTNDKNNLLKRIIDREIEIDNVPIMTPSEIHPSLWKKELDRAEKAKELLKNGAKTVKFICPLCKQKGHRIHYEQTRSADEPMTIFLTCLNPGCEHVMKK